MDETANALILPDVPHRAPTLVAWINLPHAAGRGQGRARAGGPPQGGPRTTTQRSGPGGLSPNSREAEPTPAGARRPCSRARQALATTSPARLPAAESRPPARPHRRQPTRLRRPGTPGKSAGAGCHFSERGSLATGWSRKSLDQPHHRGADARSERNYFKVSELSKSFITSDTLLIHVI